jgi:methylmalonyl-CoA mutase
MTELFSEFPQTGYDDWLKQLKSDLKSDQVDHLLNTSVEDLQLPFYLDETTQKIAGSPAAFRSQYHPEFAFANQWEKCVNVKTDDLVQANKQTLQALEHGAGAIRYTGFGISNQEELILTLKNVIPSIISIHFDCGEASPSLLYMYADEVKRRGIDSHEITGSISVDPLGDFAFKGSFEYNQQESFSILSALINTGATDLPAFKTLSLNATNWHNAGATASQELAFCFSALAEYFSNLQSNTSLENLAKAVQLRFASSSDYFLNIAKFRSIRLMWSMFLKGYGVQAELFPVYLSSETALRNKTIYDPANNLLRATLESMSAVIGGTDEHTVHPHDVIFKESTEDSRRIALNIQHMLNYESQFDKVSDAASGSYYIETLTQELVRKAWAVFLELEENGGFVKCMHNGLIQEKLNFSKTSLEKNIRTRKHVLVGVSAFAQPQETISFTNETEQDPLRKEPEIVPVEPFREAALFESLRRMYTLSAIPNAFLVCFGDARKHIARAAFSADFLSIAGFETERGNSSQSILEQLRSKEANDAAVIVLCAADEDYAEAVLQLSEIKWTDKVVLIAGKPENTDELIRKGIHDFIYTGCDAVSVFNKLALKLLIES